MRSFDRRWLFVVALVSPAFGGCLGVGWAYPRAEFVPPVELVTPSDEIHVFRVDHDRTNRLGFWDGAGAYSECTLRRLGTAERVLPQCRVGIGRGYFWGFIPFFQGENFTNPVTVRLYRPGYRTVEVAAWEFSTGVVWVPATTPDEQREAVNNLVFMNSSCIKPSSAGSRHREAIKFALSEYERLSQACPDTEEGRSQREWLAADAESLRRHAAE